MQRYLGALVLIWGCGDSAVKVDASGGDVADDGTSTGVPTLDDIGRACVIASACGTGTLIDCYTDSLFTYYSDVVQCIVAAGSNCDAARACRGFTVTPDAACTQRCNGTTAEYCNNGSRYSFDCATGFASTGPSCQLVSGEPACTGGACTAADALCEGTKARSCSTSGVLLDFECGAFGWSCVADSSGARCSDGSATSCNTSAETCSGNQVVFCRDGFQVKRDCAEVALGAQCYATSNDRAYCGGGNACTPGQATCTNASTLSYCAGGVQQSFDCVALGFSGCATNKCVP